MAIQRASRDEPIEERSRIEFLIARDGLPATVEWVHTTVKIYRSAVLSNRHFAHSEPYRSRFIVAYLEFEQWLRSASTP
ncbi:hypothetical protein [Paraburkholderia lacunae]|uniref:hypothetical protein n=1 Tax=Paraburkholderia lacunae TaxID=2211104 RepID=UPI001FCC4F17|nr:hypothetical protein [Paraburkholderia lacunae]